MTTERITVKLADALGAIPGAAMSAVLLAVMYLPLVIIAGVIVTLITYYTLGVISPHLLHTQAPNYMQDAPMQNSGQLLTDVDNFH